MLDRLVLGTAQFGMEYGVANRVGKVVKEDVFKILEYAHKNGISILDTAYSYGDSEKVIGEFIAGSGVNFDVVSKLPNLDNEDIALAERYFLESLKRLRQKEMYGYLIHAFKNVVKHKGLWNGLESLKQKKLVHKIGVSLYKPDELEYLRSNNIHFDLLQIPYNVFDQRFEEHLLDLKRRGIEIHARSVFLQGLFFLELDEINKNFHPAKEKIEKLRQISAAYHIPLPSLCLCFVLLNPLIDRVIIGVESLEQLEQSINSIGYLEKTKDIYNLLRALKFHNEEVILPYKWKL